METNYSLYYYYLSSLYCQNNQNYQNYFPTSFQINLHQNKFQYPTKQSYFEPYQVKIQNQIQIKHNFSPITLKSQKSSLNSQIQIQKNSRRSEKKKYGKKCKKDQNEYIPTSKQQDLKSNSAYLNQFRNILPNTIHQILSYIQRKNKSIIIIEKLIKKFSFFQKSSLKIQEMSSNEECSPEISISKYYAFQSHLKNRISNYVTLQTLKILCTDLNLEYESSIFSVEEQKIYNKISRTAIIYYLNYQVIPVLMSSKRMQKNKKRQHLKVNRRIVNFIINGFHDYDD